MPAPDAVDSPAADPTIRWDKFTGRAVLELERSEQDLAGGMGDGSPAQGVAKTPVAGRESEIEPDDLKVAAEQSEASSEELQARNEKLRAALEESETSRDELRLTNEELTSVKRALEATVEELGRGHSDLQNLVAATGIATVFLDRQLCIRSFTPAAVGLLNLLPSDVGRPLSDLRSPWDSHGIAAEAAKVVDHVETSEREVRGPGDRWFLVRLLPDRPVDNRVAGVVLTFADITERKRAQQGWADSEARLEGMFGHATAGIALVGLDGRYSFVNRRVRAMTGYTNEELIGRPALDLVHPDDRERDKHLVDRLTSEGAPFEIEKRYLCKDGSILWVHNSVSILRDADGRPQSCFVVSVDIQQSKAERAQLLAAERRARSEAETANAAKDRFLASLSHELRTPLAPMQMAIFALEREKRLSATGRKMIKMIGRNLEAEVQLIDELLDVSRIVHGKLEFQTTAMDVHECIHRAVEVCGAEVEAKKLRLELELGAARHLVNGDTGRLRQAFWNVLKNAAKFTPSGGLIVVRTSNPTPDRIAVEIIDDGAGIEPAALPKIFSAFEQGGPQVTRRFGGLGLGLAISHAVIRAHAGEITAASPGNDLGATFTVTLPLFFPGSEVQARTAPDADGSA